MLGFPTKLILILSKFNLEHKIISDINFEASSHLNILKKVLYTEIEMTSSITQVAYTEIKAGEIVTEHTHDSMEEVFLLLEGSCEFVLDGVSHILKKESLIKISPKTLHKIKALSDSRLFYFSVAL